MKKTGFLIPVILPVMLLFACNGGGNRSSVQTADSLNDINQPVPQADADFMIDATLGGMQEVDMGKIAQQEGVNPRVKAFGNMMVTDHSKANDGLKKLAITKNIAIPDSLDDTHRAEIDRLDEQHGTDFDKTYIDMMVKDHEKDIDEFEKAADQVRDGDIKTFITQTLPILRVHLDSAKAIQQDMK